jgi:protocatechuate 3,4-dioxygenase beta subunit
VLSSVAGAAAGLFAPWSRAIDAFAAEAPSGCIVRPEQVAGPFFRERRDQRSDIRLDSASGATQPGAPLDLTFAVSSLDAGKGCRPLAGAVVDVWNSGVDGRYMETALRGYQLTDRDGIARFRTVFPGWYSGRTVHIHFKVREAAAASREFVSEMYFEDALLDQVHSRPPYGSRGVREVRNTADSMFRARGKDLMLAVTPRGEGYAGTFEIALTV